MFIDICWVGLERKEGLGRRCYIYAYTCVHRGVFLQMRKFTCKEKEYRVRIVRIKGHSRIEDNLGNH